MRKSILTIIAGACIGLNFLAPLPAQAGRVIILVRHAEKAAEPAEDPPLSPAGMQRAQDLAAALAEARVDAILTTQFQRTRQTAAPLAKARSLSPAVIQAGSDTPSHAREVAEAVRARPQAEVVLVVGHSNTVPAIIAALGGPGIPELCSAEYATLFTLILPPTGPARLIRSSYGAPDPPSAGDCNRTMKQDLAAIVTSAQESASAARPMVAPAESVDPKLPTLFLIGDSTVRNGRGDGQNGQWGWGEPIAGFFDKARINVVNRALGGRSSRTFLTQGQWDAVLAQLKAGDFVMMQFGHNDGGPINDNSRARGTIKGIGEETEEIDNLLTHKHEVVHSFGWYLNEFVVDTRAKEATPIVCSLIPRKIWKEGRIVRGSEDYGKWAAEVAQAAGAAFVDLNEIIARRYDQLGPEKVEPLFADEHTHTTLAGAELNAQCVIAGLKGLKDKPLSGFFAEKAGSIAAFMP